MGGWLQNQKESKGIRWRGVIQGHQRAEALEVVEERHSSYRIPVQEGMRALSVLVCEGLTLHCHPHSAGPPLFYCSTWWEELRWGKRGFSWTLMLRAAGGGCPLHAGPPCLHYNDQLSP